MRNLKRVLSLVLALMMAFSLMAFSGSASAAESTSIPVASSYNDYEDVADSYKEAVDVITALQIIVGDGDNNLNPNGELDRASAAKIIAAMLLGPEKAAQFETNSVTPYTDVPSTHWASGYVAFCDNQKIISGDGAGHFLPDKKLTGYEFGKMLLTSLGYSNDTYVNAASWTLQVQTDLLAAGFDLSTINLAENLTREKAMELTFQTLQAPLVEYNGNSLVLNGQTITIGNSNVSYVTSTLAREQRINNRTLTNGNTYTVEFAEKYFPELWLTGSTTATAADDPNARADVFGRPARTWTYKTQDIGTYTEDSLFVAEFTDGATGKEVSQAIGYSRISNYQLAVYEDGASDHASNDVAKALSGASGTVAGKGALVEVYVDHNPVYKGVSTPNATGKITVVIINTWLAQATADYNNSAGAIPVQVYYGVNTAGATPSVKATEVKTLSSKDFDGLTGLKRGDLVKVTMANDRTKGHDAAYKNYTVQSVAEPEVISGVSISNYTTTAANTENVSDKVLNTLTADGTTYSKSEKAYYDATLLYNYNSNLDQLRDQTYNLLMDDYGNVLGLVEAVSTDNYIFVVAYDPGSTVLAQAIDKAQVITTDGVMKTVSIRDDELRTPSGKTGWNTAENSSHWSDHSYPSVNTWYTYTVDDDGVYILLREVRNQGRTYVYTGSGTASTPDIGPSKATLDTNNSTYSDITTAYGNSSSTYIAVKASNTVDTAGSIIDVLNVTTGITNTRLIAGDVKDTANSEANPLINFKTADSSSSTGWRHNYRNGNASASDYYDTFFIYDDAGYVLYAVVVAESASVSSNFVYFTGGATGRGYDRTIGEYYVTYPVIMNGKTDTVKILESAIETVDGGNGPKEGELYTATFDRNGYVSGLAGDGSCSPASIELAAGTAWDNTTGSMNTDNNKKLGYTQSTGAASSYKEKFVVRANTLYAGAVNNGRYVLLGSCNVFVRGNNGRYTEYADISSAMNALNWSEGVTMEFGRVTSIVSTTTGIAETLIIYQDKYEPAPAPGADSYTVQPSTHVEIRSANSGWTGVATGSNQTFEKGGTVYVKAVDGYLIDTAATKTNGVTLTDEGDGVYSFAAQDVNANKIIARADPDQKMVVTVHAILPGTGIIDSYQVFTRAEVDALGGQVTVGAPHYAGYECLSKEETRGFNADGDSVSYTYKLIEGEDKSEGADSGYGHPIEGEYNYQQEYLEAGITINTSGDSQNRTFTVTGSAKDIVAYLTDSSKNNLTMLNNHSASATGASVGVYFEAPKNSEETVANTVTVQGFKNGVSIGTAEDASVSAENRVYQWYIIAQRSDTSTAYTGWTAGAATSTFTYEVTWKWSNGATQTCHYTVQFDITG